MLAILSNNRQSPKFTPRQYFILYGSLKSNNSLQELDMANNNIPSEGAKKIAEAIKVKKP